MTADTQTDPKVLSQTRIMLIGLARECCFGSVPEMCAGRVCERCVLAGGCSQSACGSGIEKCPAAAFPSLRQRVDWILSLNKREVMEVWNLHRKCYERLDHAANPQQAKRPPQPIPAEADCEGLPRAARVESCAAVEEGEADGIFAPKYLIQSAKWIRGPEVPGHSYYEWRFLLEVAHKGGIVELEVSADHRYELYLDGEFIGAGPDVSSPESWYFATYRMVVPPGPRKLEAIVAVMNPALAPVARPSISPGLILAGRDPSGVVWDTGKAPWKVRAESGMDVRRFTFPAYVGLRATTLARAGDDRDAEAGFEDAAVVGPGVPKSPFGLVGDGRCLTPSLLPEQVRNRITPGRIVARRTFGTESQTGPFRESDLCDGDPAPLHVPANSRVEILWDFKNYFCGYPGLETRGGRGARIEWSWAESLFDEAGVSREKGTRSQISGKHFNGWSDVFECTGSSAHAFRGHWWRSGRFVLLRVSTGDEDLVIQRICFLETRYPVVRSGLWEDNHPAHQKIWDICARGLEMCAHDSVVDCPHYEQLMYLSDLRTQLLAGYHLHGDDRLARQCLEIFARAPLLNGFLPARHPSSDPQIIPAFGLFWILAVGDFRRWRGECPEFPGWLSRIRSVLAGYSAWEQEETGLLKKLPGWNYFDWVDGWQRGVIPNGSKISPAPVQMLHAMALSVASELEYVAGQRAMGDFLKAKAAKLLASIRTTFRPEGSGYWFDTEDGGLSQHAQVLAVLSGVEDPSGAAGLMKATLADRSLEPCSYHFRFYLFEALQRAGLGAAILPLLEDWVAMADSGLFTPLEMPEPSRSDCHGWSSHPVYHLAASIAGIRPYGDGYASVRIAPAPGDLERIHCRVPHPLGVVEVNLEFHDGTAGAVVHLPPGISGEFVWRGTSTSLNAGINRMECPPSLTPVLPDPES